MQTQQPITQDLVLIGGGHSHAIALRHLIMNPLTGVRLTLISAGSNTPYSGMLPGHIAGHYSYADCHIELRPLAQAAEAQFYVDRVVGLDLDQQQVICAHRPPVRFDVLSIDIGSTPGLPTVAGAQEYSTPVKPWHQFLQQWHRLIDQVTQAPAQALCLGIVGGGAGGVELALTIQYQLLQILEAAGQPSQNLEIHLFHRGGEVMTGHNAWVRNRFHNILTQKGIHLHLRETVSEVQTGGVVRCQSGLQVTCDHLFWVTGAAAPPWPREAGLATDSRGFIQVHQTLQSVSHPRVFAAGDIAAMVQSPRPKAGVFAVRQGKPLVENLRRALVGDLLKVYHPQRQFLSLISTGDRNAVASWGDLPIGWESPLLWRWKDAIDRKFMAKFHRLPAMQPDGSIVDPSSPTLHCAGCGSKVASSVLTTALERVHPEAIHSEAIHPEKNYPENAAIPAPAKVLIGLDSVDDAAVVEVASGQVGQVMVHTVDYFRSLINDPYVFAQICAHHSLSDVFAMGATPQTALAIACLPYGTPKTLEETLYQLLSGAVKVLKQAGAVLVGGHTTEGVELGFGLTCNGVADRDRLLRKGGIQPGQVLVLTKPLGTGTLFAADMCLQAKGAWIDQAVESMLISNQAAATCFLKHGATACTDITGFGLLGHLLEMVQASSVAIKLDLDALPILTGALETTERGILSSLHPQNAIASAQVQNQAEAQPHPHWPLLFDPQTSGGLLAAIPAVQAENCVRALQALGYGKSCVVGRAIAPLPDQKKIHCIFDI